MSAWLQWLQDLRHAARLARRRPGFAAVVVAAMAVGIGLNSAVFSLLDALLLRPPAVEAPERLAQVYSSAPGGPLSHAPMAYPDYEALRERAASFAALAAYAWYPLALERGATSELVLAELVTGDYFPLLGVAAALGRGILGDDDLPGAARPVVVLADDAWRRHFGGDPDVVGRELRLNGRPFTVVGVAPRAFRGLTAALAPDLWLPLHAGVALPTGVTIDLGSPTPGVERTADRASRWLWVVGRLAPRVSPAQADAEVAAVAAHLGREFPATNSRRSFTAVPAREVRLLPGVDGALRAGSLAVMGVFALGLLLAAVNVATLFLARALARRREIATRLALGAPRRRLVRQLFLEGLLLALGGGALGLLLAALSNRWLARIDSPLQTVGWPLDLVLAPELDARVLLFTAAAAVATASIFALLPALAATRQDLAAMLRDAAAGLGGGPRRLRAALVGGQVAVAVVLVAAAGGALRALLRAERLDPGFAPRGAAVLTLSPDLLGYAGERAERLFDRVADAVSELPGVRSVAWASHLPLTLAVNFGGAVAPEGHDPRDEEGWPQVDLASVGPGYFATMGIPLVAGREFSTRDGPGVPPVAILNETLARRLWPDGMALGRRLADGTEVVAVARDGKYRALGEPPRPFLYRSLTQDPRGTRTLVARTGGDPRPVLAPMRQAVRDVDPRLPVGGPRTLAEAAADALLVPRLAAGALGFVGALGLALAAAGVFGVVAYLAGERRREIGLRAALGASRAWILAWVLRRTLVPVLLGLAAGATAAAALARALPAVLPGAGALDLRAVLAGAVTLALAALAAAFLPARHAAAVDPSRALRHE